jgi:hypothetical protein
VGLKTCVWFQSQITLMGGRTPSRKVSKHFSSGGSKHGRCFRGSRIGVPESQGRQTQMSARVVHFYTL